MRVSIRLAAVALLAALAGACGGDDEALPDARVSVADATTADADTTDAAPACADVAADVIVAGWNHSLAIDGTGAMWTWGVNGSGQLGHGDMQDRSIAERLDDSGAAWVSFAAGSRHTCGVRADNTLWCWGVNVHGQLGLGDTDTRLVPTQVGTDTDWVEVVCGGLHSCARRSDDSAWCFGANPVGQLGGGDTIVGMDQWSPIEVTGPRTWTQLAAKARHTCGLRGGELWCWGDNSDGQLGLGDSGNFRSEPEQVGMATNWERLGAGTLHTCAMDDNDDLYCFGANGDGQLGLGHTDTPQPDPAGVGADSGWTYAAGGFAHTCGMRGDSIYCWGAGARGELGLGDTDPRLVPTEVGSGAWAQVALGRDHSCGRTVDGAVSCWGANAWGQVGSADTDDRDAPTPVCFVP